MISIVRTFVLGCLLVAIGGGCASSQMKGTPFYTGEYSVRQGPAEDRVNLWPLLYYRDPALSVLWPFVEMTEDHFAVRPLMSIYDRDTDNPIYNVLWPLARFNTKSHNHRIFPFFWGNDYVVGFPLYWHFGSSSDDDVYDGLLPLWSYSSHGKGDYNTHVLWPIFNMKNRGENKTGGRIWPLFGSYNNFEDRYRFALWPLGHQWSSSDKEERGSCLLPLYFHKKDHGESLFLSLPYSKMTDGVSSWETVLPLYHRQKTASASSFYSLLYSAGEDSFTEEKWNLTVPLWYSKSSPDERVIATLLGGYKRKGDAKSWVALPLLSGGQVHGDSGDVWIGGPLAHVGWDGEYGEQHVFPFYHHSRNKSGSNFYSLLWSSRKNADGSSWQLLPPLMYRHQDTDSRTLITPLYAQGTADSGETKWKSIVPLLYNRKTKDERVVATLLGGYHKRKHSLSWLALPLLAGGKTSKDESSFWAAAPLIHARWNDENVAHHIFPLYYWNGWSDTFVSLPVSRWENGGVTTTVIPPALSWISKQDQRSDMWVLGPLAHFSWGEKATTSHIFPLYYHNKESGTSLSLLFSKWREFDTDYWLSPLTLSLYTKHDEEKNLYALLGLFRQQWGDGVQTISHLIPLYEYRKDERFLSLLFGWSNDRDGFMYPLTPLVGFRRGDYSGGWLFPLWSHRNHKETGNVNGSFLWGEYWRRGGESGSGIFPIFAYNNYGEIPEGSVTSDRYQHYGKSFLSLPICWYHNEMTVWPIDKNNTRFRPTYEERRKGHGVFPLWSYGRTARINAEGETLDRETKGSVLLLLYDYKRKVREPAKDRERYDYTRSRVLWRLWHYERENGDVSVDVFPAITYDKKKDGFRKVSFLWRLFRYENGPNGKKMDLLFVPVVRGKAEENKR